MSKGFRCTRWWAWLICFLLMANAQLFAQNEAEQRTRDRLKVAILGSEFVEQQIKHNYFEAYLTLASKQRIEFRNLGWSGDTPSCVSRGYFQGAAEGFRRLREEVTRLSPDVVLVCYGANADPAALRNELQPLTEFLMTVTQRVVIVSHPVAQQKTGWPKPETANTVRAANSNIMREFVADFGKEKLSFVDLWAASKTIMAQTQDLTHDTIRLTDAGYRRHGEALIRKLIDLKCLPNVGAADRYDDAEKLNQLRGLLATKNRLYFHRYRPQNETYLRGFRKHEQGQNAKEIAEFDALIEQAEDRIWACVQGTPIPNPIDEPKPIKLSFEAATPEAELKTFQLADGLEASLFASEPMVANPIHMNFDARGRLWVATSPIYPHIKPGAKASDEILVLEDTDGDGRADKRTVFADDLLIPTAVLPDERGGAYVANSTELLHLEDTDGDGVADRRRVVLAGFGTEDTHHIIHTFRWGPDTALFFNQSIYIHTHMETPSGVRRLMGSGIWRFDPERVSANVLMRGLVNPWGHVFDRWGQSFATDGAGGDGINYAFPGSAYPTAVGFARVLRGLNPGQPKHCGLEVISGDHFPDDWLGTLVTNDFRGNRINRFKLSLTESGYVSDQLPDLLSSSHRAFRPVDIKMGPDGSLLIADWYNPIINHGEVDFRDSRRDYKHGRIWRVSVKGQERGSIVDYQSSSDVKLVELALAGAQWQRVQARIEMKKRFGNRLKTLSPEKQKRKSAVLEQLDQVLANSEDRNSLEAIWTAAALDEATPDRLKKLLTSSDFRLRAAAIRVAANAYQQIGEFKQVVRPLANDQHFQPQIEFVNAWRKLFEPTDIDALLPIMRQGRDHPYVGFALTHALKDTADHWLDRLEDSGIANDTNLLLFALKSAESGKTVDLLFQMLTTKLKPEDRRDVLSLIVKRGGSKEITRLFSLAVSDETIRHPALVAMLRTRAGQRPTVNPADLKEMFRHTEAIELAGIWKIDALKSEVMDMSIHARPRVFQGAAIRALGRYQDAAALRAVIESDQPLNMKGSALAQLANFRPATAAGLTKTFLKAADQADQLNEIQKLVQAFLRRRGGGNILAKSLNDNDFSPRLRQQIRTIAGRNQREGQKLVAAMGASEPQRLKKSLSAMELKQLVATVKNSGDAKRGESIYRRDNLKCIRCHSIGGAGGIVGPDMISLGASSPVDYIIESLLKPGAKIKEGYHTTSVLTVDGQLINGRLVSQADGQVMLRDADDRVLVINEDDIDEQKISKMSLMPDDLLDQLSRQEFVDLVAFLSQLGREGDFKISNQKLARRWVMEDETVRFSRVNGLLPSADILGRYVAFEFDVTVAGTIGFEVEKPDGLRITLDEMTDNLRAKKIVKDLDVGRHRLTFQVNNKTRREGLRVRLLSLKGSTGRARLINQ